LLGIFFKIGIIIGLWLEFFREFNWVIINSGFPIFLKKTLTLGLEDFY